MCLPSERNIEQQESKTHETHTREEKKKRTHKPNGEKESGICGPIELNRDAYVPKTKSGARNTTKTQRGTGEKTVLNSVFFFRSLAPECVEQSDAYVVKWALNEPHTQKINNIRTK